MTKDNIISHIADFSWQELRAFCAEHDEETTREVFRAKALLEWRKKTKYCPCCGTEMKEHATLTALQCPECSNLVFPRIDPCIITIVYRTDRGKTEILLARHVQRTQDYCACLAGFVEAGETIENAVRREVFEETHIKIKDLHYIGSQSWPFPQQLMLAFYAEYDGGDIVVQEEEISHAEWFDIDDLPPIPPPGSIAYRMIHGVKEYLSSK